MEPFPRLPEELVKLIFECACEPINLKSGSAAPADIETILSLLLVSRATYNLLIPRLYSSITITRPSQLIQITSTLLNRPALGLLVRNMWVGTLDAPAHFLPVVLNMEYALAAKNHITRWENEHGSGTFSPSKECNDVRYLENGAEFAAMHVQSMPTQMTQPRPPPFRFNAQDYMYNYDSFSTASSAPFGGFGVDREGAGYDASGDFIGTDEWLLRVVELQNMIEFHWEWIAITCTKEEMDTSEDDKAKSEDPMDWADISQPPSALPSVIRRDRQQSEDTFYTSGTEEGSQSNSTRLGYDHLSRFSILRQRGHSPRSAAAIIIVSHLRQAGLGSPTSDQLYTINMLQDSSESDHFSHPSLFARSGAIDLILGSEPPEGENAPPDAIPASSAVFSAFGASSYSSDEESGSEEGQGGGGIEGFANGQTFNMEGRQRARERNALDFADLYGHVSHNSRSIYGGAFEKSREDDLLMELSQTLQATTSSISDWRMTGRGSSESKPLPTLGSLLATLRACLSFCPRVRVLGLNGFLERVVGGTRECVGLSELRHLSLGPPPPYWSSALHLHQKTLTSLRSLHISGCMLFKSEAMAIGGYTTALPNLREVDWTLWMGHVVEHPINVIDALTYMLGQGDAVMTSGEKVKRKKKLKQVRATLNAHDVGLWMQNANVEIRKDERLVLQECTTKDQDANIKVVRQWWERKAGWQHSLC